MYTIGKNIFLIIFFLVLKGIIRKKTIPNKQLSLFKKEQNRKKRCLLLCIILSTIYFLIASFLERGNKINSISLFIFLLPTSLPFSLKDEYSGIDKIYCKEEIDKKELSLFKKAHIKVIKSKEKSTYEKNIYQKIKKSRCEYDNFLKAKNYIYTTYLPIVISYFLFLLLGFPFKITIEISLLCKIITLFVTEYVYKKIPCEKDIMKRRPYNLDHLQELQEQFFLFMQVALVLFSLTLPYMFFIVNIENVEISFTIYLLVFVFSNLFVTLYEYSDSAIAKNIVECRNTKAMLIYIIGIALASIGIFFFRKPIVGVQNYIACLITSIFFVTPLELIKLARFTKIKGVRNNE